jgi:hypothetical protein
MSGPTSGLKNKPSKKPAQKQSLPGFLLGSFIDPKDEAACSSEFQLTFNGLHGVISQKLEFFKALLFLGFTLLIHRSRW